MFNEYFTANSYKDQSTNQLNLVLKKMPEKLANIGTGKTKDKCYRTNN